MVWLLRYGVMKCFLSIAGLLIVVSFASGATNIEGVAVAPDTTVQGKKLLLNGAGLRTFKLGPVPLKIYVAAFYAPKPLRNQTEVVKAPGPLQFHFTFLRSVNQDQVTQAWNAQFRESATFTYDGFAADQKKFVGFFGPLQKNGVEVVNFIGGNTQVYDGETLKGTIAGKNFQKAFASMWFGSKPVSPQLKSQLLGGN